MHVKISLSWSPRATYSRFVNIRGVPGGNKPADLHNEHLNRVCKEAVQGTWLKQNRQELVKNDRSNSKTI